jgi:hypothetical protein
MMTGDVMKPFGRIAGDVIPLYGALEFRHLAGPLFLDEDYLVAGVLTDVSETPKTEIFWCDMTLRRASDPSGPVLATMTAMTRLLKMSSPLYHEPDA